MPGRYHIFNFVKKDFCNDLQFLDKHALANSADPDQTAHRRAGLSGSTLFAIGHNFFE